MNELSTPINAFIIASMYLSAGAVSEILVMHYETPGQRAGYIFRLFFGAILSAIAVMMFGNGWAALVSLAFIPHLSNLVGFYVAQALDRIAYETELERVKAGLNNGDNSARGQKPVPADQ